MPSEVWLLGDPVSRSLSVAMQNAAFATAGIDCRYVLHEVNRESLQTAVANLRADRRILGANVTIPHKESVTALLDELGPLAARIGAVNTISREDNRLKGWNTDADGFRNALDECGYVVAGKSVAVLGAGGAARAVAAALQPIAAAVWVIARNLEQAKRVCTNLGIVSGGAVDLSQSDETISNASIVVNATPADLSAASRLRPDQRLFDLRSRWSVEGRAMLLHQGARSFEIWTGQKPSLAAMRAALDQAAAAVPA